ncbi:unnamed protein product [Caenorhabditis bovis]|uniref:WAP domain-containing protein n=1 Tax=Caenorhabditis bovis TaxID=2654633 RepID=A0A8S1DZG3_9PELO|nr:unnamed protein product [Caenorhabditis bovis]
MLFLLIFVILTSNIHSDSVNRLERLRKISEYERELANNMTKEWMPSCKLKFFASTCQDALPRFCESGRICKDVQKQSCCFPMPHECPTPAQIGIESAFPNKLVPNSEGLLEWQASMLRYRILNEKTKSYRWVQYNWLLYDHWITLLFEINGGWMKGVTSKGQVD